MATRLEPMQVHFDRGRRRTLAGIAAASSGFDAFRSQSFQAPTAPTKVEDWLRDQEARLGGANFMGIDDSNDAQSSRTTPPLILHDEGGQTNQWRCNQPAGDGLFANAPSRTARTSPSSRGFSANALKRKASQVADEDDVIILPTPPRAPGHRVWAAEVVDLTRQRREKREKSFLGNEDDDVVIIDPPAAEIRRDLRRLVLGNLDDPKDPSELTARPRKRLRRTRTEPQVPNARRRMRRNPIAKAPETNASEANTSVANATEAPASPASVIRRTYFFAIAPEIREKIYRHLLVSPRPIHVQHLWTEPARRPTRRGNSRNRGDDVDTTIDTRILCVCHRTFVEGTRVLYSENHFLYQLRDAELLDSNGGAGRRNNRTLRRGQKEAEKPKRNTAGPTINLEKYGHLIRHMAIELEPNRTGQPYQNLMAAALEALICSPIRLHTLTITVSPLFETSQRTVRSAAAGNQNVTIKEGRFLSVVGFFSRGASVLKALQRINVNFLRINVHVNSDAKDRPSREDSNFGVMFPDTADLDEDSDSSTPRRPKRPKHRHLETTLDLRFLPRHMQTMHKDEPVGDPWENDCLMQEKRRQQGADAEAVLANLRKHIEDACLNTEEELRHSIWEEHSVAERRRRERRARDEAKFDGDAYDDGHEVGDGSEPGDGRGVRGMKSLIISIDRVGDELRIYRP